MEMTQEAKQLVLDVLYEQDVPGIRLYFAGISCEMPTIKLAFDEEQEGDVLIEVNEIQVAIQKEILPYTEELLLDVHQTPYGPGLALVGLKTNES
ncbi:Fe-S cluster assembly protein HesB [Priestia koreensis]|uniref:Fe-S cluster assembly protein HesB n=1 Tax=Priestia koreensis TaxID=284581 RepID=A0A0M0KX83_9BACI|nr:Fe-S cluster assembly protein HesB [Priestia koreensis]KOO43435.1 Fe-S cluster assembly protein HesB [Priestia koreensis]